MTKGPKLDTTLAPYFRGCFNAGGRRRCPTGFSHFPMEPEQAETVSRLALSTFCAMVNNGHSFEAALTAVYLTGFENAVEAARDEGESP